MTEVHVAVNDPHPQTAETAPIDEDVREAVVAMGEDEIFALRSPLA